MLENNHESMKTVVETFLTERNSRFNIRQRATWKMEQTCRELGLTGQTQIVKKG